MVTQRAQDSAEKESKQMLEVVNGCKQVIEKHDEAVKKINDSAHKASTRAAQSAQAGQAANSGKDLDCFSVLALETSKRAVIRQR